MHHNKTMQNKIKDTSKAIPNYNRKPKLLQSLLLYVTCTNVSCARYILQLRHWLVLFWRLFWAQDTILSTIPGSNVPLRDHIATTEVSHLLNLWNIASLFMYWISSKEAILIQNPNSLYTQLCLWVYFLLDISQETHNCKCLRFH